MGQATGSARCDLVAYEGGGVRLFPPPRSLRVRAVMVQRAGQGRRHCRCSPEAEAKAAAAAAACRRPRLLLRSLPLQPDAEAKATAACRRPRPLPPPPPPLPEAEAEVIATTAAPRRHNLYLAKEGASAFDYDIPGSGDHMWVSK
ncbi:hypothetical protein E2562_033889 [Oryza meyeriana var. granulata]|uniref:Uncharacterized protein n=1 Tax=Oryza meyeriana var. granulata TaxID=110450 RepID=A0A6G1BQ58_9ORYZ|nr:hypothetical protein E2562_033889 [Oryza meyeriana var. granulata]